MWNFMLVSGLRGVKDVFVMFRKVFVRVGKGSGRDMSVRSEIISVFGAREKVDHA